jgi:hypothetical protein
LLAQEHAGQPDCNGFVSDIDDRGHRTYRPTNEGPRAV